MLTYEETRSFQEEHNNCILKEISSDEICRITCQIHNKTIIATVPPRPDECDLCKNPSHRFMYGNWLCQSCLVKEGNDRTIKEYENREILEKSKTIDTAITTREDIFNAETVSIRDLERAILSDQSIKNPQYHLAELLSTRIVGYKKVIFDKNNEILEANNQIRANQQYLNTLANKLRADEREKLKLIDLSYKPIEVKPKKVTTLKPKSPALDKKKLKETVQRLVKEGIPDFMATEYTLQAQLIRHNNDWEKAEGEIRRAFREMISAATQNETR